MHNMVMLLWTVLETRNYLNYVLLQYVVSDHFKYKPDVLSVRCTCKMRVYVSTSFLINVDVHLCYKLPSLDMVMLWPYK